MTVFLQELKGFIVAEVMNDEVFEYQPPLIVFEEQDAGVLADVPDECVDFMARVCLSFREPGNPNPVFGMNERAALYRVSDGDDADEYMLTGEYKDNGDGSVDVSKYVVAVNGDVVYETGYEVDGDSINAAFGEAIDAFMAALGISKVK